MSISPSLYEMMWKLTSKFTKNPDSNIGKLLNLFAEQYDLVRLDLLKQLDWKNIDKAEGAALDELGKMVNVPRGTWDDQQYRVRIKTGIARNISDGTINNVIEILASTLSVDVKSVKVEALWNQGKPDTIKISEIPYSALVRSGMTQEELIEITKLIVSAGIDVETLYLKGTFRFSTSPTDNEISPDTGFYDATANTGGVFGAILSI